MWLWRAPRCGAALAFFQIKCGRAGARPSSRPLRSCKIVRPVSSFRPKQVALNDTNRV
jgi:hypothetical protein